MDIETINILLLLIKCNYNRGYSEESNLTGLRIMAEVNISQNEAKTNVLIMTMLETTCQVAGWDFAGRDFEGV